MIGLLPLLEDRRSPLLINPCLDLTVADYQLFEFPFWAHLIKAEYLIFLMFLINVLPNIYLVNLLRRKNNIIFALKFDFGRKMDGFQKRIYSGERNANFEDFSPDN